MNFEYERVVVFADSFIWLVDKSANRDLSTARLTGHLNEKVRFGPMPTSSPFVGRIVRISEHASFQVCRADHVGFVVASLDDVLRLWLDGLGTRLVHTGEMGGEFIGQVTGAHGAEVRIEIVSLAGQTIELLEYQGVDRPSAPAKPFDPGFAHLALVVDDIDELLARIATYGWRVQGTPQPIAGGARARTRVIYVVGPDGATIEFMQPPTAVREH